MLPSGPGNSIEAVREIQLNGEGLMTDKTAMQQSVKETMINGQSNLAFICDMVVTPIESGRRKFSAQGFSAGREFNGSIIIQGPVVLSGGPPQYVLLVSDPIEINVRSLPAESELPGFTGAIGKFLRDTPQLSTNRLRVGEPVHLKVAFHPVGDLTTSGAARTAALAGLADYSRQSAGHRLHVDPADRRGDEYTGDSVQCF